MSRSSGASKRWFAASNFAWFEERLVGAMRRLGDLAFIVAVREALPWSFIGLGAAFVGIFVEQLLSGTPSPPSLGLRLASALLPAFGVMAATLVVVLSARLAKITRYAAVPLVGASIICFVLDLPRPIEGDPIEYLRTLGTTGLLVAILACAIPGTSIALLRRRLDARLADWLGALLAVAIFAALFAFHVSLNALLAQAMRPVAHLGDTYLALVVIVFVETLLWTAGVHGPAVLAAIVTPVYLTMQMQNTNAFAAHAPMPYIVVVSLFLFVFPGGAGATLPLAGLLALSRVPRLRRVGRITFLPALFNLNEPLLFSAPVVFNPHLIIPFIGAPLVLATVTYTVVSLGLVSRAAFYVPAAVPTLISTYLATQDVRAVALASFNIALATVIYFPFVRAYERHVLSSFDSTQPFDSAQGDKVE
jgi:cellobiose-specific phosphotransferase system component IIC